MKSCFAMVAILLLATSLHAFELDGEPVQGSLMFGKAEPGSSVMLDDLEVPVSGNGDFVIGFGRDETGTRVLRVTGPDGIQQARELPVQGRDYDLERVDGLPPATVSPPPEVSERIRMEARMVSNARLRRDLRADFVKGFAWPATGRISGVYGSQRILNGQPGRPHYGLDIAAPTGTLVRAPADGVITLTHPDMYFSGGTIILDHGHGLSSTFLHLSAVLVEAGTTVSQGDVIGRIGATGRASGPHLDWRMNWMDRRVNPQPLLPAMDDVPAGQIRTN